MLEAPPIALASSFRIVLEGCASSDLDSIKPLEHAARRACATAGLTPVGEARHHYAPHGWTLVLILKESHLAIHTWPEYGAAVVELLSCRPDTPIDALAEIFKSELNAAGARVSRDEINVKN
ncbi:MAG: S-adenosylmethionine decarboxylase [Elusimicrobia bacterium]|nr:MAG: S-adenosylmethionine decarboxylase [Elusimicrobiota bacterium]